MTPDLAEHVLLLLSRRFSDPVVLRGVEIDLAFGVRMTKIGYQWLPVGDGSETLTITFEPPAPRDGLATLLLEGARDTHPAARPLAT